MQIENLDVLEVVYWLASVIFIVLLWFRGRPSSASKLYAQGQEEGRKFLADEVPRASIESFLRQSRDGGLYGPFEAGIASILNGEKK